MFWFLETELLAKASTRQVSHHCSTFHTQLVHPSFVQMQIHKLNDDLRMGKSFLQQNIVLYWNAAGPVCLFQTRPQEGMLATLLPGPYRA